MRGKTESKMKDCWWYYVRFWIKLAIKLFYRRIEINGRENYPRSGAVLLAPNHQNAFMDALVPSAFAERPIHYLTRSDVFNNRWMAAFLHSINMMPVYRQRDGIGNLAKNEAIFERCREILRNGETLLIFPEATHLGERRLRPLSKGFTRILFGALEDEATPEIHVVPLGINYSHYHKTGSRLIVNYGAPISVSAYRDTHTENAPRAMGALRDDVQKALSAEVVHLERKDANDAFEVELERIVPYYLHRTGGYSQGEAEMDFYKRRERTLQSLPEGHPYFRRAGIYNGEMERMRLHAPFFFTARKDAGHWLIQNLLLLLMLPLFLLSWMMMAPSYLLTRGLLTRYIADRQFWSSIKLIAYLVLFPLFGVAYAVVAAMYTGRPAVAAAVFAFYLLSVFVIRELRLPYRYVLTFWRGLWLKWRNPALHKYLREIESEVLKSYRKS